MRTYDLTLVLNVALDKAGQEKVLAKIKKLIEDSGGKLGKVEEWGKKELMYEIKKQKEGVYFNFALELDEKETKAIEEKLRMEEAILRFLLIKEERKEK